MLKSSQAQKMRFNYLYIPNWKGPQCETVDRRPVNTHTHTRYLRYTISTKYK